jgi:hypothetical protein
MIEKINYYDENPLDYECEAVNRMPCCILKDVMHGKEETKCVHVVGHICEELLHTFTTKICTHNKNPVGSGTTM